MDSFLDRGGNSVLAMRMIMRVEGQWGCRLPLSLIFDDPTLAHMADEMARRVSTAPSSPPAPGGLW